MPTVQSILDALQGCQWLTAMDMESAYHQVLLHEDDVPKTAFSTPWGQMEFRTLVFGLANAPAAFVAEMTHVFRDILGVFVLLYCDDIICYTRGTEADHLAHLEIVLKRLLDAQLYVKLSKCTFMVHEMAFLGHIVGRDGVRVDPAKVKSVKDWLTPKTVKEVRSFLGLANYFRRFLLGFSTLTAPLTALTHNDAPWLWTPACATAFEKVKDMLCNAPLLVLPDPSKPFTVVSDASLVGTGAVLLQEGRPVAYTSSKFIPAEVNYTTTEQEMLGCVRALFEWRCYLEGASHPVQLCTDHNPLIYLKSQKDLSRRQARWVEFLERFDLAWKYIPGRTNVADPLSRSEALLCTVLGLVDAPLPGPPPPTAFDPDSLTDAIVMAYHEDPWFDVPANLAKMSQCKKGLWHLGVSRPSSRIVLPNNPSIQAVILQDLHASPAAGHPGARRTIELVSRWFWWKGMAADIDRYCKSCLSCQQMKSSTMLAGGPLQPLEIPVFPWQSVSMDFITCLPVTAAGMDTLVVWVDRLTKYVVVQPCKLTLDAPGFAR